MVRAFWFASVTATGYLRRRNVVTIGGNAAPPSVGAPTLRAAIFCVPYFLIGSAVDLDMGTGVAFAAVLWLDVFLVFGVEVSIVYLLLFNRRTRQSLHDLAVGSYVVYYRDNNLVDAAQRIRPVHFRAVGATLAAALVLPYFLQRLEDRTDFTGLSSVQQELQKVPGVLHAAVCVVTHEVSSNDATTYAFTEKEDEIAVTITYGYDIGIASSWKTQSFALSPAQWRQRFPVRSVNSAT